MIGDYKKSTCYSITGTTYVVHGQHGTSTIPANGSISFGLSGSKPVGAVVSFNNFALNETVIADGSSIPENPDVDWDDETDTDLDGLPDVFETNVTKTNPKMQTQMVTDCLMDMRH